MTPSSHTRTAIIRSHIELIGEIWPDLFCMLNYAVVVIIKDS